MKKERKEDQFIKQPYYKGGNKALQQFIASELRYPRISWENRIEGDVHLRYDINHKGEVTDAHIIGSGLDDGCNQEACRVVKMLRFEVPKTPRKIKVQFHKTICIHFRLPAVPPNNEPPQPIQSVQQVPAFTYTLVTDKPPKEEKPATTITYTIRY